MESLTSPVDSRCEYVTESRMIPIAYGRPVCVKDSTKVSAKQQYV